jgi:5-methylcytosine-specific restriction endonuclease McrA
MPLEPKQKTYIVSALRRIWRWSKARKEVKRETKRCCDCKAALTEKAVKVDHIKPVGRFVPEENPYIMKLFCPKSNLQGMCRICHNKKTKREREERKRNA